MALYSDIVMDHFMHPRNVGEIENPDGVGQVGNAKCGDIMKMYLKIRDNVIQDVKFETFGWGRGAPPPPRLASAASTLMIRLLNMSIRDTPETAASPAEEIMTVSAIPTVIASACSNKSGTISFFRSSFENSCCFVLLSSISFIASIAFYPVIYPCDTISGNCPMPPCALLPL